MARQRGSIRLSRGPVTRITALCAFAVAVALTGCALATSQPMELQAQQPKTHQRVTIPIHKTVPTERIVIIGDSLSTGFGTSAEEAWPRLLGEDLRSARVPVEITNAAEDGAGYLAIGDQDATFASQISASVSSSTDIVVLFGSDNDAGLDPAELPGALADALMEIKNLAPHARAIMIGPLAGFDTLKAEVNVIRDQEREAAFDAGAEFVDPVAEEWVPTSDSALLGPDSEHPSSEGQHFLAEKIKAVIAHHQGQGT